MGLTKTDKIKLLHDIKRLSKGCRILRDENKKDRREFICGLLEDEVDRLVEDIEEMTDKISGEE